MDDGHLYDYMEVDEFDKVLKALDENEANRQWQEFMSDFLLKESDGKVMKVIPEVFHFNPSQA